jgi:t-SNARE complex subunit (syntaxin)
LYQLFNELAILIDSQGQKINTIALHLEEADNYMDKATIHLHKAK